MKQEKKKTVPVVQRMCISLWHGPSTSARHSEELKKTLIAIKLELIQETGSVYGVWGGLFGFFFLYVKIINCD